MPRKSPPSGGGKAPHHLEVRNRFRTLLLANPNYFGTLDGSAFQAVLPLKGDTTYEELTCVGFQPQVERLEAVVHLKQATGYGGGVCTSGSQEYVRFYLSFDGGATWQDQGVAAFTAYDVSESDTGGRDLEFAVTLQVNPPNHLCWHTDLARVRAILSWNELPPPDQPNWLPPWGNRREETIEIEPIRFGPLKRFLAESKLPAQLAEVLDLEQVVSTKSKVLGATELAELYADKDVELHRFALKELKAAIAKPAVTGSLSSPVNLPEPQPDPGKKKPSQATLAASPVFSEVLAGLPETLKGSLFQKLDPSKLIGVLFPTDGDTRYEELECVGLDPVHQMLVGVLRLKRSSGYSGGPCTDGSREYVTFWADLNGNGTFETCLGTTSVNVYDVADIPAGGLSFAVFLPFDLSHLQRPCQEGPRLVRIRAILSWNAPVPCWEPNHVPTWGNREETLVHVPPGPAAEPGVHVPYLSAVGDIGENDVATSGLATGVAQTTGVAFVDAPFGGKVTLAGRIAYPAPGLEYRVMRKLHSAPATNFAPITNEPEGLKLEIDVWNGTDWVKQNVTVHADADGYYPFEDYAWGHAVRGDLMLNWFTGAAEDGFVYDLRIDVKVDGNPAHDLHSNVVTVRVDNTPPRAELQIDLGSGVVCAEFHQGDTIGGKFRATDAFFGRYWFEILPPEPAHGNLPVPAGGSSNHYAGGTVPDPGVASSAYTLDTSGTGGKPAMDPCGYALVLHVADRTNVDSGRTHHSARDSVGFCVRPVGV